MATIRKVDYFVLRAPNRPGQGARLMHALKEHGVSLLAMSSFPDEGGSQVDLIPESAAELKAAAKAIGVELSIAKKCFLVQGKDRVGVLAKILDKLGTAKINVTAIDAVSSGRKFGAIFWVKPTEFKRAAKLLGAKS